MASWNNLNTNERIVVMLLAGVMLVFSYLAYTGFGLPTEKDDNYIRQSAATGTRSVRGGGLSGGK